MCYSILYVIKVIGLGIFILHIKYLFSVTKLFSTYLSIHRRTLLISILSPSSSLLKPSYSAFLTSERFFSQKVYILLCSLCVHIFFFSQIVLYSRSVCHFFVLFYPSYMYHILLRCALQAHPRQWLGQVCRKWDWKVDTDVTVGDK